MNLRHLVPSRQVSRTIHLVWGVLAVFEAALLFALDLHGAGVVTSIKASLILATYGIRLRSKW